ncbi:DUF3806 domain-containing protein [Agromyces bauzanensis]|uniref:DUF3806 domain-containing protein n=1 Tax=Agromyces bauzanensis TaxID=1308924 RepID=A0A917USK6_9MICO|nr:DUF3806 domain-containing protein [Agromyces bauzanensis]GGJ82846.1 hypothetical protein GCM10011372_21410 [Agromyces bauzanensis]
MLAQSAAARDAVVQATRQLSGELRVGAEQCLGVVDVPSLLERFRRRHPLVDIHFAQCGSHDACTAGTAAPGCADGSGHTSAPVRGAGAGLGWRESAPPTGENVRVGILSKRSADGASSRLPRLRDIGDPEREWIAAHTEIVTRTGADLDDVHQIRAFYDQAAARWRRINPPERSDPRVLINAIGTALGEHLVRSTPLSWMLADDDHGTELAVFEPRHKTLLYPVKLVAERWLAEQPGEFLTATTEQVVARFSRGRRRHPREAR